MYAIDYKDCKMFLTGHPLSSPRDPENVNPPVTDDAASTPPLRDKGRLIERFCCSSHQYFEWRLGREFFDFSQHLKVTSPVFQVEQQYFYLEMSPKCRYTMRLYRVGPSVTDAIYTCRAGVIGTYLESDFVPPAYDGRVNLSEDLAEWKDVQQLFTVSSSYLHNSCFGEEGRASFFFRINIIPVDFEKKVPIVGGPCNHDAATRTSTGSIVEKEWQMCKKVQWSIQCQTIKDCQAKSGSSELSLSELSSPKAVCKSPLFEVSNQTFYLSLEISRDSTPHYIRLYRSGPSVDMTVRWWMQVKKDSDCVFASRNLDLSRACVGWTYDQRMVSFEQMCESSFTVEFLMSKVDTVCGVIKSVASDSESPLDLDPSRTELLTFRSSLVIDFTVHRALLVMRVPVFEAMLQHDTVESRTGVLRLEDDPVVVAMFLHYVDSGEGPVWGPEKFPLLIIRYIAGLCTLADKYLVLELRDMCLTLFDEIGEVDDLAIRLTLKEAVKGLANILSTFPPETLKEKWPRVHSFLTDDG